MATAFHAMTQCPVPAHRGERKVRSRCGARAQESADRRRARRPNPSATPRRRKSARTWWVQIQSELKRLNRLISDVSDASRLDAELTRKECVPSTDGDAPHRRLHLPRDHRRRSPALDDGRRPRALSPAPSRQRRRRPARPGAHQPLDKPSPSRPNGGIVPSAASDGAGRDPRRGRGPGIPADQLENIFDRFYSDRPADRHAPSARTPGWASASRARS